MTELTENICKTCKGTGVLKTIADEEERGTDDNHLIGIITGELEDVIESFWGEPPDEDPHG